MYILNVEWYLSAYNNKIINVDVYLRGYTVSNSWQHYQPALNQSFTKCHRYSESALTLKNIFNT